MLRKGPTVSPVLTASVLCLLAGSVFGYYLRFFTNDEPGTAAAAATGTPAAQGGGGGSAPPGGGGGGFGGGPPAGGAVLARLVRNLDMIETVQGKGMTPAQARALLPVLQQVKAADTLPAAEAEKQSAAIQQLLTPEQKQALESLQPRRGGGGAGGGGGGGGYPGGGGGGGRPDPERPFASGRSQEALDSLIARATSR